MFSERLKTFAVWMRTLEKNKEGERSIWYFWMFSERYTNMQLQCSKNVPWMMY